MTRLLRRATGKNLVLPYDIVVNGEPVKQVFYFIECDGVSGEAVCDSILHHIDKIGLDVNYCRLHTIDGVCTTWDENNWQLKRDFDRSIPYIWLCMCISYISSNDGILVNGTIISWSNDNIPFVFHTYSKEQYFCLFSLKMYFKRRT